MAQPRGFLSKYEEPFRRSLLWIALYYLAGKRGLTPASIADPDLWWHLRVGEWIVQHRWVPYTDAFSSSGMGRPWAAYSWLFEVLVFELHKYFGLMGVLTLVFVFALLITWLLHRFISTGQPRPVNSIVLTGVAFFAMAPLLTPRPWLFTLILFLLELQILVTVRRNRNYKLLYLLPLVFVFWANTHIQFVYGFVVLALFTVESMLTRVFMHAYQKNETEQPLPLKLMTGVFLLCVLSTFLNPYHVRLYLIVFDTLKMAGFYNVVSELKAMEFRALSDWFVLILTIGAAFSLGKSGRRSPLWVSLLLLSAVVSFRSRRDVWFCVLTAVTIITYATDGFGNAQRYVLSKAQTAFVILVTSSLLLATIQFQRISEATLQHEVAEIFPVDAVNVVVERGYVGPLFNDFNWGGYLMWRLPRLPVAIDGRGNLHNAERVIYFNGIWGGRPGWNETPEVKKSRLVIAEKYAPLTQLLRLDEQFKLVYEDEVAVVFVANGTNDQSDQSLSGIRRGP